MKKTILGLLLILPIILVTGCGKKSIVGKWKAIDTKDEFYYIFNEDKTCSYEMAVARLDCTYEIDGEKLTMLYKGTQNPIKYEYHIEEDTLVIKDNNNEYKYSRE